MNGWMEERRIEGINAFLTNYTRAKPIALMI